MNIVRPADNPVVLPFTNARTSENPPARPLPGLSWMPTKFRNHFIAFLGEFVGTFLFLFFAFAATQIANMIAAETPGELPSASVLMYIALAFGFSLSVNVWVFFRISGGLFNPAVRSNFLVFFSENLQLTERLGHSRSLPHWSSRVDQRLHSLYFTDTRRHRSSRNRFSPLPRSARSPHNPQYLARNFRSPRPLHRDVPDRPLDFHNVHLVPPSALCPIKTQLLTQLFIVSC
jgi:hypothetical protein